MWQVFWGEEWSALTKEKGLYYIEAEYAGGTVILQLFYFKLTILSCLPKVTRRPQRVYIFSS